MSGLKDHNSLEKFDDFEDWVGDQPTDVLVRLVGRTPTCLADFVQAWVQSGDGVRACQDFKGLMVVLAAITMEWSDDPTITRYYPHPGSAATIRNVGSVYGAEGKNHILLNPQFFEKCMKHYNKRK